MPVLGELVTPLDRFCRLAPGAQKEDEEDLAWAGVKSEFTPQCIMLAIKYESETGGVQTPCLIACTYMCMYVLSLYIEGAYKCNFFAVVEKKKQNNRAVDFSP